MSKIKPKASIFGNNGRILGKASRWRLLSKSLIKIGSKRNQEGNASNHAERYFKEGIMSSKKAPQGIRARGVDITLKIDHQELNPTIEQLIEPGRNIAVIIERAGVVQVFRVAGKSCGSDGVMVYELHSYDAPAKVSMRIMPWAKGLDVDVSPVTQVIDELIELGVGVPDEEYEDFDD